MPVYPEKVLNSNSHSWCQTISFPVPGSLHRIREVKMLMSEVPDAVFPAVVTGYKFQPPRLIAGVCRG